MRHRDHPDPGLVRPNVGSGPSQYRLARSQYAAGTKTVRPARTMAGARSVDVAFGPGLAASGTVWRSEPMEDPDDGHAEQRHTLLAPLPQEASDSLRPAVDECTKRRPLVDLAAIIWGSAKGVRH